MKPYPLLNRLSLGQYSVNIHDLLSDLTCLNLAKSSILFTLKQDVLKM